MQGDRVRQSFGAMYKALNIGREKTGEDIEHDTTRKTQKETRR